MWEPQVGAPVPPAVVHSFRLEASAADLAKDWIIAVVRDGAARLSSGHGAWQTRAGDVVLVVPGAVVKIEPADTVRFDVLALDGDWLETVVFWHHTRRPSRARRGWELPGWRHPPIRHGRLHPDHAQTLTDRLDELIATTGSTWSPAPRYGAPMGVMHTQMLVLTVMDHLSIPLRLEPSPVRWACPSPPARLPVVALRPELHAAWEALHASPADSWTLARLAAQAHLSTSQFGRLFVAAFGTPPMAYLTLVRIQVLAHLLRTTMDPVAACAEQVGWSPSYAARQFRRITGMTPHHYRHLDVPGRGLSRA